MLKLLLIKGAPALKKKFGNLWGDEMHMYGITGTTDHNKLALKMKNDITQYLFPFLSKFKTIDDIINQTIGKMFDYMGFEHHLFKRWGENPD